MAEIKIIGLLKPTHITVPRLMLLYKRKTNGLLNSVVKRSQSKIVIVSQKESRNSKYSGA